LLGALNNAVNKKNDKMFKIVGNGERLGQSFKGASIICGLTTFQD